MKIFKYILYKFLFNIIPVKTRFNIMYKTNFWDSSESVSGPGSEIEKTHTVRNILPEVLNKYKIESLLDLPCGDFNWMKYVNLGDVKYIGADIVKEIIIKNKKEFSNSNFDFQILSIYDNVLPNVDLVFSRDCFIHFSNKLILQSLNNIKKSGSTYLFTNHYPDLNENIDIKTGTNRPINLQCQPFNLPDPVEMYEEEEFYNKTYGRKMVALWKLSEIKLLIK